MDHETDTNKQMHVEAEEFNKAFDELWGPIIIDTSPVTLPQEIAVLEQKRISLALDNNHGNRTKAAEELGLGRTNLIAKLKKYKLDEYLEAC